MDLFLKDKVAFVTAASRGLGFAVARAFAKEGCKVAICSRDSRRINDAAKRLREEFGVEVVGIKADLSMDGEPERFVAEASSAIGEPYALVINTGYPRPAPFSETSNEDFDDAYRTLLRPVQALIRATLPSMKARSEGRIIAIASIAIKAPVRNLVLSNAVRVGVAGLVKTLSREYGRFGITANTICPGYHLTERLIGLAEDRARREGRSAEEILSEMAQDVPVGRLGDPDGLGALCVFLASPLASYINGATIQVDGGLYEGLF